jgi:NADH:ubiquinone oxidoreductase subunit H
MAFGWKYLLPASIANLVVTALVVAWKPDTWLIH